MRPRMSTTQRFAKGSSQRTDEIEEGTGIPDQRAHRATHIRVRLSSGKSFPNSEIRLYLLAAELLKKHINDATSRRNLPPQPTRRESGRALEADRRGRRPAVYSDDVFFTVREWFEPACWRIVECIQQLKLARTCHVSEPS